MASNKVGNALNVLRLGVKTIIPENNDVNYLVPYKDVLS